MTPPDPAERSLRMFVAERDEVIAAQRARIDDLERRLEEQYQLVARYRRVLAPLLWVRRLVLSPRRLARRAYEALRRVAWRHPRLARPAVWLKRRLRGGPAALPAPAAPDEGVRALLADGWYAARHPEAAGDPWGHYRTAGWQQGHDPNPLFDARWYVANHPEAAGADPLEHYVREGWQAGFDPGPLFSVSSYLAQHPDVARAGLEPLRHYLEHLHHRLPAEPVRAAPARPRGAHWADLDLLAGGEPVVFEMATLVGMGGSFPRPEVSGALHRLAAQDATVAVRSDDPEADRVVLEGLGFELDGVEFAAEVAEGAVHVRVGGNGGGPHVIDVPPEPTSDGSVAGLREDLSAAASLLAAAAGEDRAVRRRVLRAAFETALLPTALVAAAVEEARANDLDRVHYLSREGQFLARVHERVAHRLAGGEAPRAITLEVSRRSTFGPSLPSFDAEALLDLWRMYSRQSVGALLTSLGDRPERYATEAAAYGIDLDTVIENIHLDPAVARFVGDPVVSRRLADHNAGRRAALLAYLQERTDPALDRWLVVDVGWRGTIQDNLARLLPGTQLDGIYLVLFPFLNPQPPNTSKRAAGPDANEGDEYGFMEPPAAIERPWTADVPSVVDYRVDGAGRAVAVLEKEHLARVQSGLLALFQDSTLRAAELVADWMVATGRTAADLRPDVKALVREYYLDPWPGVADLWFGSEHDDTFGVLNVTPFGKDRPSVDWLAGEPLEERIAAAAEASQWAPGYRRWLPVQGIVALDEALRTGKWPAPPERLGEGRGR